MSISEGVHPYTCWNPQGRVLRDHPWSQTLPYTLQLVDFKKIPFQFNEETYWNTAGCRILQHFENGSSQFYTLLVKEYPWQLFFVYFK